MKLPIIWEQNYLYYYAHYQRFKYSFEWLGEICIPRIQTSGSNHKKLKG